MCQNKSLLIFFIVTVVARASADADLCGSGGSTAAAALTLLSHSISLNVTLLEPGVLQDPSFFSFLGIQRPERLTYFSDTVKQRFPNVTLQMAQVSRSVAQPFSCLGRVITDLEEFVEQPFTRDEAGTSYMLLAAGIFPNYVQNTTTSGSQQRPLSPASTSTTADISASQTFHVIVMFAEGYKTGDGFKGDGSDTCQSEFPDPSVVRAAADKANTLLLLVTPSAATQLQWRDSDGFDQDKALLYPSQKALNRPDGQKYTQAEDTMAPFIRDKATEFICSKLLPSAITTPGHAKAAVTPVTNHGYSSSD